MQDSQPTKRSILRQQAAQGSLSAMQLLIDRAVAHKQLIAEVFLDQGHLQLTLKSKQPIESPPEPTAAVLLVCRELSTWHHPCFTTVEIAGFALYAVTPAWLQQVDLTAPSDDCHSLAALTGNVPRSQPLPPSKLTPHRPSPLPPFFQALDRTGWRTISISLFLAIVLVLVRPLGFLLHPFLTLVHELGHTVFYWLFGYFAIPAFDFIFGGGMTLPLGERSSLLLFAITAGFGYLFYHYRHQPATSRVLLAVVIVYSICASTPIHTVLILSMGHGFELLFAGIFLYRALSGWGCQLPIERPLYGMLGFFAVFYNISFAYGLIANSEAREIYEEGKGGLLDNDFVIVARDYLQVDLSVIAILFLLCCLVTPVITYSGFYYRSHISDCIHQFFLRQDA